MPEFRIAVKGLIHNPKGEILLLQRQPKEVHAAGEWDIPGGRLEEGENTIEGVKREALEEANLPVDVIMPVAVDHFTRDDGQVITMIIFLCKARGIDIKLSDAHTGHRWEPLDGPDFPDWLKPAVETVKKFDLVK